MKKIILIGRTGAGKTTLMQALNGDKINYHKTQYINNFAKIIDTPGEYAQVHGLGAALALYTYESDIVGLLISATEPFSIFPPNVSSQANREVIGIITHIDDVNARVDRAKLWLELAGVKKIFLINSLNNDGVVELMTYLDN